MSGQVDVRFRVLNYPDSGPVVGLVFMHDGKAVAVQSVADEAARQVATQRAATTRGAAATAHPAGTDQDPSV